MRRGPPSVARSQRRHHARDRRCVRPYRRRLHLGRRHHQLRPGARHRPGHRGRQLVLLAIDVGNTQTVIGLYGHDDDHELDGHRRRARPARPLAHRHLGRAHVRRAGAARAGVPRLPRVQLRRGRRRRGAVLVGAEHHRRRPGDDASATSGSPPIVVEPGVKTGMPILYDNPKQVGPDRIADAVAALRPLRRPDDRRRLRHRDDARSDLGQGRVPRRRDPPGHRDQPRRAVRPRGRAVPGRAGRAAQRDRQEHDRVDPVGRALRLRRPGRRDLRPDDEGAGRVHGRRAPAVWPASSHRSPMPSSTTSPGSRCTACA